MVSWIPSTSSPEAKCGLCNRKKMACLPWTATRCRKAGRTGDLWYALLFLRLKLEDCSHNLSMLWLQQSFWVAQASVCRAQGHSRTGRRPSSLQLEIRAYSWTVAFLEWMCSQVLFGMQVWLGLLMRYWTGGCHKFEGHCPSSVYPLVLRLQRSQSLLTGSEVSEEPTTSVRADTHSCLKVCLQT